MKLIILEGARGTGKSTLASKLRQKNRDTTLVNFTGFDLDGEEGLKKITHYYDSWLSFLHSMKNHDSILVADRSFFSESVFAPLYKEYDFSKAFKRYVDLLPLVSDEIHIFHLTIHNEKELGSRLIRDKIPFGKAEENIQQTLLQQESYVELFMEAKKRYRNHDHVYIHTVPTDGKTNDEVYSEIMMKIERGS